MSGPKDKGYRGCQTQTRGGYQCQNWNSQKPHGHGYTPERYPNSGLVKNYCRNPSNGDTVWCYTTDPNKRWDYCDAKKATTTAISTAPVIKSDPICEGRSGSISCPAGTLINVLEGFYGRKDMRICFNFGFWQSRKCSSTRSTKKIYDICQGKAKCKIIAIDSVLGGDPCPSSKKYAFVQYQCLPE